MSKTITGFSKLSKEEKIDWLAQHVFSNGTIATETIKKYWNSNQRLQKLHDGFIENTITNFYLPFGVAPNFLINKKLYVIPMAIEESSVVAAASNSAKFWFDKGGFTTQVISTTKNGQVHFNYFGKKELLKSYFEFVKPQLINSIEVLSQNMNKRGGGLLNIDLIDKTKTLENYFQLHCTFETVDAMGANFINSCLEKIAQTFKEEAKNYTPFSETEIALEIVMSILSNYVPECLVKAQVSCNVSELNQEELSGTQFARKFIRAIDIAKAEPRRAVTHNKGIMNGIDAVILATGNDFRAVEAGVHAYASKDGAYTSLTHASLEDGVFKFWIEIPLALGTVGGLTSIHPLANIALDMLQKPNAEELMQVVAVAGLAQNFAAIRSLVTTGIQKGHMKMHLMNILNQLQASDFEKQHALLHFNTNTVTHGTVTQFLENLRKNS